MFCPLFLTRFTNVFDKTLPKFAKAIYVVKKNIGNAFFIFFGLVINLVVFVFVCLFLFVCVFVCLFCFD